MSVLDGFRVIDFGQYIAGPLVGMLLADQGADVIRVDPPGGPRYDTPANATWNRGKRSIVLDLKQASDLETARRLISTADVVVENFRPGVMERLGLGPLQMSSLNPRLVYCSMPGFASDDPRAGVPAWEGVVGAAASTYRGSRQGAGPGRPVYTPIPIASCYAAFMGTVSIAMALFVRERDGLGQRIEVPLFDAMFPSLGNRVVRIVGSGAAGANRGGLWGGQFETKDDWAYFGSGNQNFREFIEAVGIASWDAEGLTDRSRLGRDRELAAEQERRIVELFKTKTAQEWEDLISEAGSECTVCRSSLDWINHPHARESQAVIQVDDPKYGRMWQPGINARMSLTPGKVRWPAPEPDAHRDEILSELGARQPVVAGASQEAVLRSALEGVRVLDLCIVLAGPTCGRTMMEFGADVIKIDNPSRALGLANQVEVNRGKRSILLDLKMEEGKEVFWRLLEDADVVVQNYRKGKIDKLGLGYDEVRKRKPHIIYASLNSYGHLGPWAERPGHEQLAQAATGMQWRYGGGEGYRPVLQPNAVNDYGTGYMGAYGVALALLHKRRTGQGQHVDTALAYTATTLQSPFMNDYEGKVWDEPHGQNVLGDRPLHRAYQASDGWVFIGGDDKELSRLATVQGLSGIDGLSGEALERALEERFATAAVATWVDLLTSADFGAHRVIIDPWEPMNSEWAQERGLSMTREVEGMGTVTTSGPAPRLSRTPVRPGRLPVLPGADAREILAEVGLGDEYEPLLAKGIIGHWSGGTEEAGG